MAKSIRSKIKRKHRAEFRKTIGTEAYNANMASTQAKMKQYLDQQSMNSFDRLSETLGSNKMAFNELTDTTTTPATCEMQVDGALTAASKNTDDATTEEVVAPVRDLKGENKALPRRKMCRKHKLALVATKKAEKKQRKDRPRPKYFCQF